MFTTQFNCDYCEENGRTPIAIMMHIKEKHEGKSFICSACKATFVESWQFMKHCEQVHTEVTIKDEGPDEEEKQENQKEKQEKQKEQQKNPKEKPKEKEKKKKMKGKGKAKGKIPDMDEVVDLSCSECLKQFVSKKLLWSHKTICVKDPQICDMCSNEFKNKYALRMHIKSVHQDDKIMCNECGKHFKNRSYLWAHKTAVHDASDNNMCHICGTNYKNSYALKNHVKKCTLRPKTEPTSYVTGFCDKYPPAFYCKECDKHFVSVKTHQHHVLYSHTTGQTNCRICRKKLKNTVLLRQHLRRQHGILDKNQVRKMTSTFIPGSVACNVCGKQMKNSEMLKKHYRRVHSIFDPQMMVEMMSADVDLDIPEQSPESPIEEVPGDITPPERKQPAFPQHVQQPSNYGGHWAPQGQFGYMGHNFGTWGSNWGYPYNMGHASYGGYQPPVTPLYQPGPFKQEPNNSEPLNLYNRGSENTTETLYGSEFKDDKDGTINTSGTVGTSGNVGTNNNSRPPEDNNQTADTNKKEDEGEITIKDECISEQEDESDESDYDESSSEIYNNKDDEDELSEDEGNNSYPTIPVDTIIKYEKDSDDDENDNEQDEDFSPNNSLKVPPGARIKCPLNCKSTFKDRTGVLQHLRRLHKTDKTDASKMIFTFVTPEVKSDVKVVCTQCQQIFLNQRRLDIHVANYHLIGDYTCDKCGETFHLKGKLKVHVFSKHTQPVTRETTVCHICTKNVRNINAHIRDMHTNAGLICHLCTKTFQNQKYLSAHISSAHTDPSKQRMCPHCSKMCKNSIYLRQHINKVHSTDEDKIDCPKCTKTFKNRKYLGAHLSTAHTDPGAAKVCPVCSKVLKNGVYYRQHINKMHGGQAALANLPHVTPVNLSYGNVHDIKHGNAHGYN